MRWWISFAGAAVLAAGLAACGGGGGGDAPGAGTSGPGTGEAPYTTVNLAASNLRPTSISATLNEGGTMPTTTLTGSAVGDVGILNGRTLYVIIEDPASLFETNPQVMVFGGASPGMAVTLHGRKLSTAGSYRGNLRVFVCLDPTCSVRLGNVPVSIPYDVTVRREASAGTEGLASASPALSSNHSART